ncbi:MAG TPA: class I SAM-dependent methyltransferase [Solirubrobacterales bacterium]|nr:class I SAM-dependent methyltransferase [Solirubrobacterales bacterium]
MSAGAPGSPDFGQTAADYGRFRAGFPEELVDRLDALGVLGPDDRALDVGTGTGTLARLLAPRVDSMVGTDPAEAMLGQARELGGPSNLTYEVGVAERTGFADEAFELVTAGQCWHWFDRPRAAAELSRVLVPGGHLVIAHFDWIPLPGNVVEATEALIREYNPEWAMGGGTGLYPAWLADVAGAGLEEIETFSFDLGAPYSHEAWVGRIRASAGVGASLPDERVRSFSADLTELLAARFPEEPLSVHHRTWALVATKPGRVVPRRRGEHGPGGGP